MFETIKAYLLDWDPITVESYNEDKNEVTMVFNCDITTEDKSQEVIKYVVGRTIWCFYSFPKTAKVTLSFDIRGQAIIINKSNVFKDKILRLIDSLNVNNEISIDFLR